MVYLRVVIMAPFVSQLARLERLVSKQEDLLRDYRPPVHVAPLDPELKRKVRRDTSRTCWGWGGGAWRAQRGNLPRSSDFLSPLLVSDRARIPFEKELLLTRVSAYG